MTDFYPLLVRAVSKLSTDRPQARQELYDHARKFLIAKLSGLEPSVSAPEIMREQIALEAAIGRVEAQSHTGQLPGPSGLEPLLASSANLAIPSTIRQPSIADHQWPDVHFDRIEGQSEISTWPRQASQSELSAGHLPETVYRGLAELKNGNNEKIAPRDLSNGMSVRMGLPNRDLRSQPAEVVQRQKNSKNISVGEEIFESKRFVLFDPAIIGLAAIVAMLTFIAVISIALAAIYFPRLVWFSQHLVDHPTLIVGILISSCFNCLSC